MKNLTFFLFISFNILFAQNSLDTIIELSEVQATFKAVNFSPVNYQNISSNEIKKKSIGQEPSILLSNTPSITYSVDGGHSQGYSYFRLRGLDQTRINITFNGVPLNDPMDQAFYFSNFADILNSIDQIQIQRGVSMTKNGNANYAGSIELFSNKLSDPQNLHVGFSYGSYNAFRSYMSFNSGLKNKKALNIRISKVYTDGFKQHASHNGNSLYLSSGLFLNKSIWKINILSGAQKNGLAWMSVPEHDINIDKTTNANSKFEKDDFSQLLSQIENIYSINNKNTIKSSFYYTHANGWWIFDLDNYYGIPSEGNNLSRSALNSNLFGIISNYEYSGKKIKMTFGLHGNTYQNEYTEGDVNSYEFWYKVNRYKDELSVFNKMEFKISNRVLLSTDVQLRNTSFDYRGDVMKFNKISWCFINPKMGLSYKFFNQGSLYLSLAKIGREPAKYDMFQGNDILSYVAQNWDTYEYIGPEYGNDLINKKPEFVNDLEIGLRKRFKKGNINLNYFYMDFQNERILNGQTGPSGLALRSSVDNSIRTGIEFFGELFVSENFKLTNNSSYNYSLVKQEDISFTPILTPKFIINQEMSYSFKNVTINFLARYQSTSYMNFENSASLNDYFIVNGRIDYRIKNYYSSIAINNLTNANYYNNGEINLDGSKSYWVQTPRNFYVSIGYEF